MNQVSWTVTVGHISNNRLELRLHRNSIKVGDAPLSITSTDLQVRSAVEALARTRRVPLGKVSQLVTTAIRARTARADEIKRARMRAHA